MTVYRLVIGAVDGVTSWAIGTNNISSLIPFYNKYGHEGDSVTLEVWEGPDSWIAGNENDIESQFKKVNELHDEDAFKLICLI